MKYVQPIGGAANDPYVDANPSGGIDGSAVPAAAIEHPMRELANLISDAGLTPTDADLTQVAKAIKTIFQKAAAISAAASGTVDAITANYTPAVTALADHMLLIVRASGANTSTTPTFTPASATIAAKTIVKGHNQALVAGDISGAGFRIELQYDLTLDKWVLLNPATGVIAGVRLTDNNTWLKAQRGAVSNLVYAATITPDFSAANNFSATLTGNATLANPTNLVAGQSGVITITQDATGSRTLAYGNYFKFSSGMVPSLTTTANAVDNLAYYVESTTRIWAALTKGVA